LAKATGIPSLYEADTGKDSRGRIFSVCVRKDNVSGGPRDGVARSVFAAGKLMDKENLAHLDPPWWKARNVSFGAPVVNDAPFFELEQELRRVQPPKEHSISLV
jgi:hypothetical protein